MPTFWDGNAKLGPMFPRAGRNEFPTNSQISHEADLPSTMTDYIDNDHHRVIKSAFSLDDNIGINAEQDATGMENNLGLFGLDPEDIEKRPDDLLRDFYHGIRVLR
jgi:hypothetical protein